MDDTKKTQESLKKVLAGKKGVSSPDALKEAEAKAEKNHDNFLRVAAEFENYKKRMAKDHEERAKYSHEHFIKELLPVLDDFDRILDHLPQTIPDEVKNLVDGMLLTHRHLLKSLKKFHLEEVETKNQIFDPHLHEAIGHVESDDHKPNEIVTCHRKGYRLYERLLRPSVVTIAKEKREENDEKN